jgi:hypothetical protein
MTSSGRREAFERMGYQERMDQNLLFLVVPCFSRPRKIPTSLENYDIPAMAAEEHSGN